MRHAGDRRRGTPLAVPARRSTRDRVLVAAVTATALATLACGRPSEQSAPSPPPPSLHAATTAAPSLPTPAPTGHQEPSSWTGTDATPRAGPRGFTLVVTTRSGDLRARVAPISVASRQLVDPPHHTPRQWNTAAWVVQAAYPAVPSTGTTYVYGHACHHHTCPFTDLKNAAIDDRVVITTATQTLTYRVARIGLSPKSARTLPHWASNSTIKNRVVLVTCEFEHGDTSLSNSSSQPN